MTATAPPPVEQFGPAMARLALGMMRHAGAPNPDAPHIAMYVTPWYRQACGWFAIAFGIALAARGGARVSFLINDMPYPAIHPQELDEVAAFETFCRDFEAMYPYSRLSAYLGAASPDRRAIRDGVVDQTLLLDARHRVGAGTLSPGHRVSFLRTSHTPLSHIATAVDGYFAKEKPDAIYVPGGVANGSYVVTRLAADHGVRIASVDSSLGSLFVGSHSIASQFSELAETYQHLISLPARVSETARAKGFAALEQKIAAAPAMDLPPCDLILPLGYDWDTVALGVGSLYEDQGTWLRDTVSYVLAKHPSTHIVVRAHPHELRHPNKDNAILMDECVARRLPNLHVMRAQDRIPVYGLLTTAKAVVACQSTVVMEAQMKGVPAIALRDNYYVLAGAVPRPHTREAYHHWLDQHLAGPRAQVSEAASAAAALLYFLLESVAKDPTRFTPHADDFWAWLNNDPVADLTAPFTADLVRAIAGDIPLATLKARRTLGLDPVPPGARDLVAA